MTMRVGGVGPPNVAQQLDEVSPPMFGRTMPGQDGKPVVFLHGYGGTPADSLVQPLAAAFRRAGVALDITVPWVEPKEERGDRVIAFAPTTLSFELAQIQKLADQTPGKLTLIGHSFGGLGARIYATMHPEKVERMVLLAPGEGVARRTVKDYDIKATDPAQIEQELRDIIEEGKAQLRDARDNGDDKAIGDISEQLNWLTMCADIISYDAKAPISALKNVPTLLIHGTDDENITDAMLSGLVRQPNVKLLEVPGGGHGLEAKSEKRTTANYDMVASAIASFLGLKGPGVKDEFALDAAPVAPKAAPNEVAVPQANDDELFTR